MMGDVQLRREDDGTVTVVGGVPDVLPVTPELLASLGAAHIDEFGHLRLDTAGVYRYRPSHLQAAGDAGCVVVFRRIAS